MYIGISLKLRLGKLSIDLKFQFLQRVLDFELDQQSIFLFNNDVSIFIQRHQKVSAHFQHFVVIGIHPMSPFTAALGVYVLTLRKYLAALFCMALIHL